MIQSANPAVPKTVWLFKSTCAVVAFAGIMCSTNLASQQDDGFYVLSVARNIASGRGITIDGHAKSNGFQPLWALVTVPIFVAVAGDRELGVRAVLWLQWLLLCGTAYLLSTIIRTVFQTSDDPPPEVAFWATAFVYLTGVLVFAMHFNLLETGLLLFMYTLIARVYQLGALADRRRWLLYVLLGLLVLTRIDAAFFVVALSLMQLWKAPNGDGVKSCGLMLLVPFLVSSPWWLFNFLEFGSLMPSSGAAQTELTISVERIRSSLFAVTQVLTQNLRQLVVFEGGTVLRLFLISISSGLLLYYLLKSMSNSPKSGREHVRRMTAEFAVAFLLTFGFLISYYTLTSSATHFYSRYYGPLFLFGACALGSIFSWFIRRSKASVFLLITMFLGNFSWYHWTTHRIGPGEGFSYLAQVELVDERVPLFEPVAAWQSGTLGYFRDDVVNLDGKVNAEAMAWRGDMNSYLEKRGIRYICDWPSIVEAGFQDPKTKGWSVVARKGRFTLYERSSPNAAGVGLD